MPLEASPSFVRAVDTHYDNQSKLRNLSGLLGEVKQEAESAARIAKSLRNIAQAHVQSGRLHLITKSGEQIATKALEASLDKAKHTLKKVGFEFDLLKGHVDCIARDDQRHHAYGALGLPQQSLSKWCEKQVNSLHQKASGLALTTEPDARRAMACVQQAGAAFDQVVESKLLPTLNALKSNQLQENPPMPANPELMRANLIEGQHTSLNDNIKKSHLAMSNWIPQVRVMKECSKQLKSLASKLGKDVLKNSCEQSYVYSDNLKVCLQAIVGTYEKDIERILNHKPPKYMVSVPYELETFTTHVRHAEVAISTVLSRAEAESCQHQKPVGEYLPPVAESMAELSPFEQKTREATLGVQAAYRLEAAARTLLQQIRQPEVLGRVGPISEDPQYCVRRYAWENRDRYRPVEH